MQRKNRRNAIKEGRQCKKDLGTHLLEAAGPGDAPSIGDKWGGMVFFLKVGTWKGQWTSLVRPIGKGRVLGLEQAYSL